MSKLRCQISISADGFVAGPNQSEENPLGEGGERLPFSSSTTSQRQSMRLHRLACCPILLPPTVFVLGASLAEKQKSPP